MLEFLAQRCVKNQQTPYFIKGPFIIKDVFERERKASQLSPGDNVYITAKIIRMEDANQIDTVDCATELVWIKDIVSDNNELLIEIGGNKILSTFDFSRQWKSELIVQRVFKSSKKNCWPFITERSNKEENIGNQMIYWEPPKIEDYRVKSPTLFHYSDPLFEEQQEILEAAYQQSVKSYNTRVNNFYEVLAQACILGKIVPFYLSQQEIINVVSGEDQESIETITLTNMITGESQSFNFQNDIELYKAYVMHDHFVIHLNIGLVTSRRMEELFSEKK